MHSMDKIEQRRNIGSLHGSTAVLEGLSVRAAHACHGALQPTSHLNIGSLDPCLALVVQVKL